MARGRLLIVFILGSVMLCSAAPKEKVFKGSVEQVFDAAVKSATEAGWTVNVIDRKTSTFNFDTGFSMTSNGMKCTVVLQDLGAGKVKVILNTRKRFQAYAWGVGGRIADKFFKGVDTELAKPHSVEAAGSTQ